MNKRTVRITGAQCSFSVGAIQQNKNKILECFEKAESVQSDIIIFPREFSSSTDVNSVIS